MLNVCEIFTSIQGESGLTGLPCTFIRLSGCNLQCVWCDTAYSRLESGNKMSIEQILREVSKSHVNLVEITGGEPLLQKDTAALCKELLQNKYSVMIETNGTLDISVLDSKVKRIVDIKCPGSGAGDSFLIDNIKRLTKNDEVKFVVSSVEDAGWAKKFCEEYDLSKKCAVIFSPVMGMLSPDTLAGWLIKSGLDARLGIQLHKVIWGDARGR